MYESIGKIVLNTVALCIGIPYKGFVIQRLWMWFLADTFWPAPSVAVCTGICLMAFILTPMRPTKKDNEDDQPLWAGLMLAMLVWTIFLGIGWVVAWFV